MHRSIAFLPLIALLACSPQSGTMLATEDQPTAAAGMIEDYTQTPVHIWEAEPERQSLGQLAYRGGLHIEHTDERFGGWSALEIDQDGTRLLAVSDSAYWMSAQLEWSDNGWLSGIEGIEITPLLGREGQELVGDEEDSEAIAHLGGSRYAVSFERNHRIKGYDLGADHSGIHDAVGIALRLPPGAVDLPNNGGLEGMTAFDGDNILIGREYPPQDGAPYLLYYYDGQDWSDVRVASLPGFAVTSLTRYGDHIYMLERFYTQEDGTRIRIVRFPLESLAAGSLIEAELLGALEAANPVDNFEGISVIEHNGETTIVIVSDDNYNAYGNQRSLFLAFALED